MTMFVVANLGDAVFTFSTSTVTGGGTVATGGFVFVNNTSGTPITLTLSASVSPFVLIKDVAGNAGTNAITVTFSGGIDGVTSVKLDNNYQKVWLVWNGASYSLIG